LFSFGPVVLIWKMQSVACALQRVSHLGAAKSRSSGHSRCPSTSKYTTVSMRTSNKSQFIASKYFSRSYSIATPHPANPESTEPVPILESLTKTVPASKITQNSMLLKLEDLVPLPNSFAVVAIGGHQVRLSLHLNLLLTFRRLDTLIEGSFDQLKDGTSLNCIFSLPILPIFSPILIFRILMINF
jgi:hypothetical protein